MIGEYRYQERPPTHFLAPDLPREDIRDGDATERMDGAQAKSKEDAGASHGPV